MATSARNGGIGRFTLVVGFKLDAAGTHAVEEAVQIAQRIPKCSLHLVHVMEGSPTTEVLRDRGGHLRLYADEKIASLGGLSGTCRIHVSAGDPGAVLGRIANEHGADLLVIGSGRSHGLTRWLRTSFAEHLATLTSCNVVVAGTPTHLLPIAHEPAIEPPCHACVTTRFESKGDSWWCSQHDHHGHQPGRPHTYSYRRELPLATRDRSVFLN